VHKELHNFHSSLVVVRMINLVKKIAGHVTYVEKLAYCILFRKLDEKKQL